MAYCSNCGHQLKEGAKFCPKCGKPIYNSLNPQIEAKNGNLHIRWDGAWIMFDTTVTITSNGTYVGDYSFKEGFRVIVPIDSDVMRVGIKCGFRESTHVIILRTDIDYSLNLSYNPLSGGFGYSLCDNKGFEIQKDSLHWGMGILCFLIPIIGLIYALYIKKNQPAAFKDTIIISLVGFIVNLIIMLS